MSEGFVGFRSRDLFELRRLNRALTQVARPAISDDWKAPLTRTELIGLGVFLVGRPPKREEVIERLWSRKRQILRQSPAPAWDRQPPVA